MQKNIKKFVSILVCLSMMLSLASITGFAASDEVITQLADKLYLHTNSFYSSNAEGDINENYFVYAPNSSVTPYLCHGNDVEGAASMARVFRLEREAGNTLICAMNADYFTTATGVPLGLEIKDGIIKSSASYSYPEIGFYSDGRAIIGKSNLNVKFTNVTQGIELDAINYNKGLTDVGGVVLFHPYFGDDNNAPDDKETLNVRIKITGGTPRSNEIVTGTVLEVFDANKALDINDDEMLLSIYKSSYVDTQTKMSAFMPGDSVQVSFTLDSAWTNVTQAFGGKEVLVESGSIKTFSDNTRAPRTAIGTKADGTVVCYTCDGRDAGGSKGLSLSELARRMSQLGCTNAINLDGGASTQVFVVYPGNTSEEQINEDSGVSLRSCANYICFKNNLPKAGDVAAVYAYENEISAVAGAIKTLGLVARDSNWHAVTVNKNNISYALSDIELGTASAGSFSAGLKKMDGKITAIYEGHKADYIIHVLTEGKLLANFESYELANTNLSYVHNGYKSLKLESGEYYNLYETYTSKYPTMISFWAYGDASNVYVEYTDGSTQTATVGEFNSGWNRYVLSLGSNCSAISGIGNMGEKEVYIDQVIVGFGRYIDDTAPEIKLSASDIYLTAEIKDDIDDAIESADITVSFDGEALAFTYDKSLGTLAALMPEADNNLHHVIVTARDESGNIGRETIAVDRSEEGIAKGNIFSDVTEKNWSKTYCEYLYNRGIIKGYVSGDKRYYKPSANMTRQEFASVITSWYGADLSLYEDVSLNFTDNAKIASWAVPAVKAAVALGMMGGRTTQNGLAFDPEGYISRQEVMAVIGRILERGYSSADLSLYKDAGQVASWAKPYVEVLVGQEIINGSNGKLLPNAYISREAVAKIIYEID